MTYATFVFPPRLRAELSRLFPEPVATRLVEIARLYAAADRSELATPSEIRKEVERLGRMTTPLIEALHRQPHGFDDAVAAAAWLYGDPNCVSNLIASLRRLDDVLGKVWQVAEPSPGRPPSAAQAIVMEIATVLEREGMEINASVSGPLCRASGYVLQALGEEPDIPKLVARALEGRAKRQG